MPGALLSIVVLYRHLFWDMFVGLFRRDPIAIAFVRNLLLAFFPAVILGLALGDQIELLLENAVVVAWALVIGGFVILLVERFAKPEESGGVARSEEHTSELQSLLRISYSVFC